MPEIPQPHTNWTRTVTRNTKEAALMYSLAECQPVIQDGKLLAMWLQEQGDRPVCWFHFNGTAMCRQIHSAFEDRDFERKHSCKEIPDEHMTTVLALIKTMWHNWERLREFTNAGPSTDAPLHQIARVGNRVYIKPAGDSIHA